jgi:FAD/FMN-containing dehydrogenase/Fe-S oxidoreductase
MNLFEELAELITGDVFTDDTTRRLYATDASAYRELPVAVVMPRNSYDLQRIAQWGSQNNMPLIPRAAGTSLAGQVVGAGVVIDTGRYMNSILAIDTDLRIAVVEPGVIRDDLNKALKPFNLFFSPETSTSNRCMIGGMVGNNACGAHSLLYGSTRDHLLEVKGFLMDGTPLHIRPVNNQEFQLICQQPDNEGEIYAWIAQTLKNPAVVKELAENSPWPEIRRRNTGYALDLVSGHQPFNPNGKPFNLAPLIAGSEGTLMLISEITLSLTETPPKESLLVCAQFHSLEEAFEANLVALKHPVSSIELIDNIILECTEKHPGLRDYRFFIQGAPEAVLVIEFEGETMDNIQASASKTILALREAGLGYHYPIVTGAEIGKVWELRKAGLGLLSNVEGPAKPVSVIEDTAVRPQDLPAYMREFRALLKELDIACVFYAHIATGEIHLKPLLDLKNPEHVKLFRTVAFRTAELVKKYRGSLSGEHGDGRLRGEFIPLMSGENLYLIYRDLKNKFDPKGLLNPGKITDTPPMDTSLRYSGDYSEPVFEPYFVYSRDGGFLTAIERCNGSGDCRRPHSYGGTMCPSYQASGDERLSTRGRSNLLREVLSSGTQNPFADPSLHEILDQCLSCKGCKAECPSAVDMARYKAEVMHQYYKHHPVPLGVKLVVNINKINRMFTHVPWLYNGVMAIRPIEILLKTLAGIHPKRKLPRLSVPVLSTWIRRHPHAFRLTSAPAKGTVVFFVDEFTNFFDSEIGLKGMALLHSLGYDVKPYIGHESGRAAFSKGDLKKGKLAAETNVRNLRNMVSETVPLIGTEPSAILSFKDEYPDIVSEPLRSDAANLARHTMLIEDFLVREWERGSIAASAFNPPNARIVLHGHCHQKALSPTGNLKKNVVDSLWR